MNRKTGVILAAAGMLAACGTLVPIAASATQNHDKPWICHPVEGNGETGYGWNLINPDEASKHMDEHGTPDDRSDDTGLHTRKDGRTDVYADGAICPGAPTPTTTETTEGPTPSSTTTSTPSSTTTSSATPSPTETTSTSHPTGPTHPTGTTTAPAHGTTPPTTATRSRSSSRTTSPAVSKRATSSSLAELPYTGAKTGYALIGVGLLGLGLCLHVIRRRYLRQH